MMMVCQRMMRLILCCVFVACVVTACSTPRQQYNENAARVLADDEKINKAKAEFDKPAPVVVDNEGVYADPKRISLVRQPRWMKNRISINGSDLPFDFFVSKILERTGALVHYGEGMEDTAGTKTSGPTTLGQVLGTSPSAAGAHGTGRKLPVSFNFAGTVKDALDTLANQVGYVYHIKGNSITWSAFETRTFNVSFVPGDVDFLVGDTQGSNSDSSSSGSGDVTISSGNQANQDDQYSNLAGQFSVWDDLQKTVETLLSAEGKATVSKATTTITVHDRPDNVRAVARFIEQMNQNMSQQVAILVQIIEVDLFKNFTYGINWNVLTNDLALNGKTSQGEQFLSLANTSIINLSFGSNSDGVTAGSDPAVTSPFRYIVQALRQQGNVSVLSEPRVVTLNNQIATVDISQEEGYLASSTTTLNGDSTSSDITPGVQVGGFKAYILPKIEKDNVYLQVSSSLATLRPLQTVSNCPDGSTASNCAQIQVPNIDSKRFFVRSLVPSGNTLILAGFKQLTNEADKNDIFNAEAVGGHAGQRKHSETVILITPEIIRLRDHGDSIA